MNFARLYKYRNIPFCTQCAAHTKFIPVQNNSIIGATTLNDPNSNINVTQFTSRSEQRLICSICAFDMFRWADVGITINSETDYFKKFYSQFEFEGQQGGAGARIGCLWIIIIVSIIPGGLVGFVAFLSIGYCAPTLAVSLGLSFTEFILMFSLVFLFLWILLVTAFTRKFARQSDVEYTQARINELKSHTRIITLGKGLNGETVLFHQRNGQIEYK